LRAAGAADAAALGASLIASMAEKAGMPPWPQVRAEAALKDLVDAENAKPTLPELVSVPEAAEILGVSHQRVRELAADGRGFPTPVYELKTGKLWLRAAIVAFAERRQLRPGRPSKGAVLRERVTSALLDRGMTVRDVKVDLVNTRNVVIELCAVGGETARWRAARAVVTALSHAGLGVWAEDDSVAEIESHLVLGHRGVVYELSDELRRDALH